MIPVYGIREKDPSLFIKWSTGEVVNRRTCKTEKMKFVTMGNKHIPYVSKNIIGD